MLKALTLIGCSLLLVVLAGCGRAGGTPPGALMLSVEVGERFAFIPDRLHCQAGQMVRLRLTSRLRSDGADLMHNVVVLDLGVDPDVFGQAAVNARMENNYLPVGFPGKIVAASGFARSGEAVELVFVAPPVTGVYPVICTFPGHCLLGMKAQLTVE